jgi:hypothetical protein
MHHGLNWLKLYGVGIDPEAISPTQGGNADAFVPDSGCYPLDYGVGLILFTATENVKRHIAILGPGMN